MKALVRFAVAATAAFFAIAPAQLSAQDAAAPAPDPESAVGPAQLRDFSLGGTVIRRSDPPPERSQPAAERQSSTAANGTTRRSQAAPPQAQTPAVQSQQREAARPNEPVRETPNALAEATQPSILDFPPPTSAMRSYTPAEPLPASTDLAPVSGPAQPPAESAAGLSPLPWILALLLLGAGAFYVLRRQRAAPAFAGAGAQFEAPRPAVEPRPRPEHRSRPEVEPAPAPPPPSQPVGIVSARLRPELDLRFAPSRLAIEESRVTLEFEVAVVNSGGGPARDVLLEAAMFSAGPEQDREIGAFHDRPRGQGERVPIIAPLESRSFTSTVTLPRDRVRQFQAGDRIVFVPLIGFNLLYRWSGKEAQTSTSYLIGIDTRGERLAPFRLDPGPRLFADLAARELGQRLRK